MKFKAILTSLMLAAYLTAAQAQTISTASNADAGNWGPGSVGVQVYGETLTVPNGSGYLRSFTFDQLSAVNSSFTYKTYVYAYNPVTFTPIGAALYTSSVGTVTSSGAPDSIMPDLHLTVGGQYIVFVSSVGLPQTNPTASGFMAATDPQTYTGGHFYFSETSGDPDADLYVFSPYSGNAAFTANFGFPGLVGFNHSLSPNQYAVGSPINAGVNAGNANPNFVALVNGLQAQPALGPALDQLSPEEFGRFTSITAFNNASFETEAMDNYLAGLRDVNGNFLAGNGQIDSSGLTMNDPSYDPGLAQVHSRLLAWNPAPFDGTISDVANPMFGGMDTKDMKDMKAASGPAYTDPWNFFVRGNVILAQGFSQPDTDHFDDNTESVVLGTDYRINPNFLVGITAGYGHTDVTLDDRGSSATVDSYSPGLYASYADKGWYANVVGSYTHNAYTQARNIGFLGQTANSAPEGNEGTADLDGGYDFHVGALTFGPQAGVQYTHLTVDGYHESGSIGDLNVNDQESDSLRSRLGARISYAFSHYGVTFRPHLDASWQHEFLDQSRGITSQFDGLGLGSFSVRTDNPSRDSALAETGLDADFNRTLTAFADYQVQAGQQNYFGQAVQAGVRIGF